MNMRFRQIAVRVIILGVVVATALEVGASPRSQSASAAGSLSGKTLTVSTWGGSWTDAFKKWFADPFSKQTGVQFNYVVSGIDPVAPVLLQEQGNNVKIDVVDSGLGSELQIHHYLSKFPRRLYALMKKLSTPGAANPYWWTYGTVTKMIVCNPHIAKRCPKTPKQFFDVKHYPGNRMLINDPRETIVFALEAAGVSKKRIAHNPPLGKAMKLLAKIKPYVKVFAASGSQQQQTMANGDAAIGLMWESRFIGLYTGDYPYLKAFWNGAFSENDFAFLVPKNAPDAKVAFAFLKWIALHQGKQGGLSTELGTFTPGNNVLKHVSKQLRPWMPQSHPGKVFYFPSLWYAKHAQQVQTAWQSTIG